LLKGVHFNFFQVHKMELNQKVEQKVKSSKSIFTSEKKFEFTINPKSIPIPNKKTFNKI